MAKKSRTTDPSGAPYRWEWYCTKTVRVVENELEECLQSRCLTQSQYEVFSGEVEARLKRACVGGLGVPGQPGPDPVATQPDLWETRWSFSDDRQLRLYHGEPLADADLLLGLKYHWKQVLGLSYGEIQASQNEAMAEAGQRFAACGHYTETDDQDSHR